MLRPAPFQSAVKSGEVARVEPNRKWFGTWTALHLQHFTFQILLHLCGRQGNTKVITQSALQTFQEEMGKVLKDPYKVGWYCISLKREGRERGRDLSGGCGLQVIMKKTGLPISLLQEKSKVIPLSMT